MTSERRPSFGEEQQKQQTNAVTIMVLCNYLITNAVCWKIYKRTFDVAFIVNPHYIHPHAIYTSLFYLQFSIAVFITIICIALRALVYA